MGKFLAWLVKNDFELTSYNNAISGSRKISNSIPFSSASLQEKY